MKEELSEVDAARIVRLKAFSEERETRHSCGLQGFDPAWDICEVCKKGQLMEEGLSEVDAARIARLEARSCGRPTEIGLIERAFKKELQEALEEIENRT